MLKLLKICLINPGTDRVMCTALRKNRNHTDELDKVTCPTCITYYALNREWWDSKFKNTWADEVKIRLNEPIGTINRVEETDKGINVNIEWKHPFPDTWPT